MSVADEMKAVLDRDEETLAHYGMPRRSGRYPWGSGEEPYQRSKDFLGRVEAYKKQGLTESQIAEAMGILNEKGKPSTTRFRAQKAIAKDTRRSYEVATAKRLRDKEGLGNTEIGRKMGLPESTVRSLLNEKSEARMNKSKETADFLRKQIKEKGMIDVGVGVERELNISKEKLNQALAILQEEGYPVYKGGIPQATNTGKQINQRVICPPGTQHKEIYEYDKVHTIKDYISRDGGETYEKKFHYPESLDSKRLKIRYNEDGGLEKDGIIELRRGVDDLSLGESRYSQVRIMVDGTHYLKGMAVYSDKMPEGVDVVFNTNKKRGTPMTDVLKEIKKDPDNPFGSLIKDADQGGQYWYTDKKTGEKKLGLINKRADEGDWTEWKDALPSQFLSKQALPMINKQLGIAKADKQAEYDELCSLTNPTIKKHLLEKFANECDASAVHLKAAALPGQKYHVIIPINTLKDNEIYAPGYPEGSKLALVRYPHGGTFEIPIVTVTNKNKLGKEIIGATSMDAVGVNHNVADRLSGADFDGDTVMCIPTHDRQGKVKVTSTPALDGLKEFEPKTKYGADKVVEDADGNKHYYQNGREYRIMKNTGTQMGVVSNLITDMTLGGADEKELAAAVRHSMVVIDAEKHKLNYKQSEIDNNISALKKKYQRYIDGDGNEHVGGASTLLSRAKGEASVPKRQGAPRINQKGKAWYDPTKPEGALVYKTADDLTYTVKKVDKRTGKVTEVEKKRTQKSTRMAETDDANTLVSEAKHPKELAYADYANSMKHLAIGGFINYCENELTLTDGEDLNLLDSFKLWAEQIFGWYYFVVRSVYEPNEDGYGGHYVTRRIKKRLINKQYLIVARGAAKSMYASCIQSYFLNVDSSTTHQVTTAPTMPQAEEVLSPIRTSITRARGPLFQFLTEGSLFNTTGSRSGRQKLASTKKGIENFLTGSLLEVRPMRIDKLQGLRVKCATVDEWLSGDVREDVIAPLEQGAAKEQNSTGNNDYMIIAISSEGTVRNGAGDTIKMELTKILKGEYKSIHTSIWWYKLDSIDEVSNPDITQSILDGTADDKTMLNYYNRTIEPIISAIVDEMKRKFLSKTARTQRQSILFFRDPFKLVPVNDLAEVADKFTRNEIMSKNEFRQIVGMKPSDDPKADQLINSNISQSAEALKAAGETTKEREEGGKNQNGKL